MPMATLILFIALLLRSTNGFCQIKGDSAKITLTSQPVLMELRASYGDVLDPPCVAPDEVIGSKTLPPVIQQLADERKEFDLNLGKAMDILRQDYPEMLRRKPDFSIYHENISVIDPSGVRISNLKSYENSFKFLQAVVALLFNKDVSTVQNRMVYDFARSSIRVSWNVMLLPKVVGNRRNAQHVDGISIYKLDTAGKIVEHRIESLLINGTPLEPPFGVLSAILQPNGVGELAPSGAGAWALIEN